MPIFLDFVKLLIVPFTLIVLWGYGFIALPLKATGVGAKRASSYARWAGLIIFVLFVTSRQGSADTFLLDNGAVYPFSWGPTAVGLLLGYFSSTLVEWLINSRVVAFLVLVWVALMSIAVYAYLFMHDSQAWICFLVLGFSLGALLNKVFPFPGTERTA